MDTETTPVRTPPSMRLLWLLLTVPLAGLLAFPVWFAASLNLCGISGCSGGGFGVAYGPVWVSLALDVVVGLLFLLAIVVVPWGRQRWRVGGIVGGGISLLLIVSMLAERYPSRSL